MYIKVKICFSIYIFESNFTLMIIRFYLFIRNTKNLTKTFRYLFKWLI